MKRNERLLLNTIIIAIGTFTTKALSFIMVPFYTVWLSPEEYGNFDLLITYISFFIPFATFQLEQAIFRFCIENKDNSKKYYSNAIIKVFANILICNFIILLLLRDKSYLIPFIIYFDCYAIYNCSSEYLRGIEKIKMYSVINVVVSVIIVLLNITLVYIKKLQIEGMLWSYAIAYLIGIILINFIESPMKDIFKNRDKTVEKEMMRYALPLIPNSISWWITHITDRTVIKIVMGNFYNGIYAVSCKIPTLVNILFSVFNLSWQQTAIKSLNDADKTKFYNDIYNKLIKFLYTSSYIILSITPFIFEFFIAKDYYQGIYQIPIILNGIIFLSIAQFLNAIFLANKDTKSVGITTTIVAVINFLINICFINFIGLTAASLSTLISYFVLFFIRHKKLATMFENKKIMKRIVIYNIIYILYSVIINIKFNLILNSIIVLTAISLFFIKNRKIISKIINKFLRKGKKEEDESFNY